MPTPLPPSTMTHIFLQAPDLPSLTFEPGKQLSRKPTRTANPRATLTPPRPRPTIHCFLKQITMQNGCNDVTLNAPSRRETNVNCSFDIIGKKPPCQTANGEKEFEIASADVFRVKFNLRWVVCSD
ncbi:hypothetical protein GWI33_018952 [Rhynchophorus ferrugineus]|uniref:Uncharacterized protein n=1 Tax=Rhynchophorus ferrugineus TaxID=354439 RepID=A0A834M5R5_RHYFE|nr:hypothetical protein GWI33_018952 [Rhynchophorus ferrugineus]